MGIAVTLCLRPRALSLSLSIFSFTEACFSTKEKPILYYCFLPEEKNMAATIEELTINYEEDGQQLVKETGKVVLSKGAWTTIIYRYNNWKPALEAYDKDMYTIRRYQKKNGEYMPKSKFNISSAKQAQQIVDALSDWLSVEEGK
ncbi:unknown protein [Desulfotalea psychrophila LSv54]|uniref:Uncharacterized protein n=2 Tax=Desulfotalea psychrophila TaxID=84980 RepID=Q6ALY5_DESPS|nr:unknown protein [Desulfotalea psychrophila LSv54]